MKHPGVSGGPFRGSELVRAGRLTRWQLTGGGAYRRLFRDVYVERRLTLEHFDWCEAVALILPAGAAIGGWSALSLHTHVTRDADAPVEVVLPARSWMREHPRLRISRGRLDPADVHRFGAIPVTTPVRTGFDLARGPSPVGAVIALDALLVLALTSVEALADYAEAHRHLHGALLVPRRLSLAVVGAESPMETRTRLLLVAAGLPLPVLQHEVRDQWGAVIARVDLAYPQQKVAIEYEGDHHRGRHRFQRDVARLNRLRIEGWTVLRFTADDVLRHPRRVVAQVRQALGL